MIELDSFAGSIFAVSGFEGDEHTQVITQIRGLGGKIVGESYSGIPDYGVVPVLGAKLKQTVSEIVTDLFIVRNFRVEVKYFLSLYKHNFLCRKIV